jgi:hypothetical protein
MRPWVVGTVALALLGIGAAVASQVGSALGISFEPVDIPREDPVPAPARPVAAVPAIGQIAVPDDKRVRLAAEALAGALAEQGAARPAVVTGDAAGAAVRVSLVPLQGDEAFRLTRAGAGFTLEAGTPAGAANGLYQLADRVRAGTELLPAADDGKVVSPRLGLRLTDAGSVGLDDDPAGFVASDDYSLNTDVVGSALLPRAPYVDSAAVASIAAQFHQLVDHALAQGYNGVVLPGFLEYVTFAAVPGVYPAGDPHVARAKAMVEHFAPVWQYAHDMGMKVYFATDMLALSPPLQRYLERTFGSLAVDRPGFWSVYQTGLRELFQAFPFADGLMIRVGEGGSAYKFPGWDYVSQIAVKTATAVQTMLRSLLVVAGEVNKDVIFRTWSIGVGAVGDMHTNPRSYLEVLGGLDDPHLVVSTKYCLGDYYSYLPLNDTLKVGTQRRIVEFQSRREFEGLGALPNDLGPLDQTALRELLAANPHIEGLWNWSQAGGPLRAGPRTLYLRAGFWQMFELNNYANARLAWNPDADPAQITADWARQTFSRDPSTVEAIGRAMALSRPAIMKGLYIGPYARQKVKALGLEPPPMMWIFEWDIVTGDSAVLDSIYTVSKDQLDAAIREGDEATELARRMRALVAGTDPATWRDPALRQHFVDTLDFEVNLFDTLGAYRAMFLRYAQWQDTGSASARAQWVQARARYIAARDEHLRRYTGNVDLPAYRFPAADIGLARADRDETMAWIARGLLAAIAGALAFGALRPTKSRALHALWVGLTRPWRVGAVGAGATGLDRVLVWAVPAAALALSRATYTWFAAPAHLLVTLGSWGAFAAVLRLLIGRSDPFALWAALGGVALGRTALLLAGLVLRGPGHYWLDFWTKAGVRSGYITLAFAAFLWVFVSAYFGLRASGVSGREAVARALIAAGVPVAAVGALTSGLGLEDALAAWNDQMALLPWGMHRILGITGFLDLPPALPRYATGTGAALIALGAALAALWHRRPGGV